MPAPLKWRRHFYPIRFIRIIRVRYLAHIRNPALLSNNPPLSENNPGLLRNNRGLLRDYRCVASLRRSPPTERQADEGRYVYQKWTFHITPIIRTLR